jgi:hypothetical protein
MDLDLPLFPVVEFGRSIGRGEPYFSFKIWNRALGVGLDENPEGPAVMSGDVMM